MDVQLPAELWLQIGGHLPRADLNRLVRTSHAFHSLLLPRLYRDIILSGPYEGAIDRAERLQAIRDRLERISEKSELVPAIRSCRLSKLEGTLLEEVITFLGTLPNLSGLFLNDLTLEAEQLTRLSKSWRSPIEFAASFITIKPFDLPPSVIKETAPNLSSLTISNAISWSFFVQWSFSANLETLRFGAHPEPMLDALFEEHIGTLPKVSFPRLKSLCLFALPNRENQGRFFDCMPMLENLYLIPGAHTTFRRPLNLSQTAIPRLRHYDGLVTNVLSLVPRRPVQHLGLSGQDELPTLWGSHTSPVPNFGSTSAIRYLYLQPTADPLPSLQLLALVCPSLYELRFTRPHTFRLSAPEFVQKHIQHLYKLNELRRLVYTFFVHAPTPNSVRWERLVCEALSKAAPNLTSVSLMPVITWDKSEVSKEWKEGGIGVRALETNFRIGRADWPAPPPPPNRDS